MALSLDKTTPRQSLTLCCITLHAPVHVLPRQPSNPRPTPRRQYHKNKTKTAPETASRQDTVSRINITSRRMVVARCWTAVESQSSRSCNHRLRNNNFSQIAITSNSLSQGCKTSGSIAPSLGPFLWSGAAARDRRDARDWLTELARVSAVSA